MAKGGRDFFLTFLFDITLTNALIPTYKRTLNKVSRNQKNGLD